MFIFGGIIFVAELLIFVAGGNREIRLTMWPCANGDQYPARFSGQFSNIGDHKFGANGTVVVDRDIGFDSILEVRGDERFSQSKSKSYHFQYSSV